MKKLMIMAAVCAMASVSQAYAVKWSATNVRIPVADNPKVSQTGIKTTTSSDMFAQGALTISLFYVDKGGTEQLVKALPTTKEGGLNDDAIEFNDTMYKAIVADNGGDAVEFVMRATYATADGKYDFYMNKTGVDITATETKNVNLGMNMNNGSWNYTANTTPPGPGPIPEPTSGLLLLLGVAGLALRRRRA